MKNKLVASLVLGTLVLVGGGCLGKKTLPSPAPSTPPSGEASDVSDDGAAVDADVDTMLESELPPADVDAAVDDIIDSVDAVQSSDDEVTDSGELDDLMSDTKELEGTSL